MEAVRAEPGARDLDDALARTVRLLAQLTRQVAIVQYPVAQRTLVRHVELLMLTPERMMVIVVQSSGRVDQTMLENPLADESRLQALRHRIAEAIVGRSPGAGFSCDLQPATNSAARMIARGITASRSVRRGSPRR